ncbi:NADPH-dependent L-lysine N(6)-monooxygenase [Paenibacillus faecis]|uniref:NADPH-dependent L-lysine N(6)-monooxygenase n=1 Tax=Paenibacillus faecis TaxID=862114 RepID=A0A5D0CL19_9BACL|nr:NAD(P)/FAD-dependent oxidoreductase [Paenibacillus faecis]TYA10230.1 NADPH-dependent L-lysine N(6)-monooxygenase [Paenibacillus faecis]
MRELDVLVIGAGQAGLAMGYYLKKSELSFEILGMEKRIGDTWRNRYDSLILFTPRWYSALPGVSLAGDPQGLASKDEMADYLEKYAEHFELPVKLETQVLSVEKDNEFYIVKTNKGPYKVLNLVIATGPFSKPHIPQMADGLSPEIFQIHTSSYRNVGQLHPGNVLVVGAGNSGAQIAVELAGDREVHLSAGHPLHFFPLRLAGKNIFWWFRMLGILDREKGSRLGDFLSRQKDPIFGTELKRAIGMNGVRIRPRTISIDSNTVTFMDSTQLRVDNIIWATGFVPDYGWLHIPGVLDGHGRPVHHRGISPVKGLYYLGLPWLTSRKSALIGGVGDDAEMIYNKLISEYKSTYFIS